MEVYRAGTETVALDTGHRFEVATLPSIVLLKLIAFDDRPERRSKDARDIAGIIHHFFDLQAPLIYSEAHLDLFEGDIDDSSLQEIAAIVIGREIRKIISRNEALTQRVQAILHGHIAMEENSAFVRNMVAETGSTVMAMVGQLKNMLAGLTGA